MIWVKRLQRKWDSDAVETFQKLTFLAKIHGILPGKDYQVVMAVTNFSIIVT